MHIYGPVHLHGAQPIGPPHTSKASKPVEPNQSAPINDELQISEAAQLVDQVGEVPEVRQDRVDAIRAKIAAGSYETAEKLQVAVDRLFDEIG